MEKSDFGIFAYAENELFELFELFEYRSNIFELSDFLNIQKSKRFKILNYIQKVHFLNDIQKSKNQKTFWMARDIQKNQKNKIVWILVRHRKTMQRKMLFFEPFRICAF